MDSTNNNELSRQLEKIKREIHRKEKKLRRYSQVLEAKQHVQDTLKRCQEVAKQQDNVPSESISSSETSETKCSGSKSVTFCEDSPEVIFVTPTPVAFGKKKKKDRIHKKDYRSLSLHGKKIKLERKRDKEFANEELQNDSPLLLPSGCDLICDETEHLTEESCVKLCSNRHSSDVDLNKTQSLVLDSLERKSKSNSGSHRTSPQVERCANSNKSHRKDVLILDRKNSDKCKSSAEDKIGHEIVDVPDCVDNSDNEENAQSSCIEVVDSIDWNEEFTVEDEKEVIKKSVKSDNDKRLPQTFKNEVKVGRVTNLSVNAVESQDLFSSPVSGNLLEDLVIQRNSGSGRYSRQNQISSGFVKGDKSFLDGEKSIMLANKYKNNFECADHQINLFDDVKIERRIGRKRGQYATSSRGSSWDSHKSIGNKEVQSTKICSISSGRKEEVILLDSPNKTACKPVLSDMRNSSNSVREKGDTRSYCGSQKETLPGCEMNAEKAIKEDTTFIGKQGKCNNELSLERDCKTTTTHSADCCVLDENGTIISSQRRSSSPGHQKPNNNIISEKDSIVQEVPLNEDGKEDDFPREGKCIAQPENEGECNRSNRIEECSNTKDVSGKLLEKEIKHISIGSDTNLGKILSASFSSVSTKTKLKTYIVLAHECGFSLWEHNEESYNAENDHLKVERGIPKNKEIGGTRLVEWVVISEKSHHIGSTVNVRDAVGVGLPSDDEVRCFLTVKKVEDSSLQMIYIQFNLKNEWLITVKNLDVTYCNFFSCLFSCILNEWSVALCWNSVKSSSTASLESFLVIDFDVAYSRRSKQWELLCSPSLHSPSWCTEVCSVVSLFHSGLSGLLLCTTKDRLYIYDAAGNSLIHQLEWKHHPLSWAVAIKDLIFVMSLNYGTNQTQLSVLNPISGIMETFASWNLDNSRYLGRYSGKIKLCDGSLQRGKLLALYDNGMIVSIKLN